MPSPALIAAGGLLCLVAAVGIMGCQAVPNAHDPDVVFESDWSTDTGTSRRAVTDGGRWKDYWEFNNGRPVQLLSVVPGGPRGSNALRVLQRGPVYAAFVQQNKIVPLSTDFFVRYYMRNDDTSWSGDHIVTPDFQDYGNLTYMRKMSRSAGWQFVVSMYGCPTAVYPLIHLGPAMVLARGVWYRFEYHVHFMDATHIQLHVRVYDAPGVQILGDADIRQADWGNAVWNGRRDWTLASYYAAGHTFCVNPAALMKFGMGNNGQRDAIDTGLPWYFARVQIRTDWWPGP